MEQRQSLTHYIRSVRDIPFKWGEHDCLTFTNGAWRAMYGHGWADDWIGRYMLNRRLPMRTDQLRTEFGFDTFDAAADARLTRLTHVPPVGAIVASDSVNIRRWMIGYSLGVCLGAKCAFLSEHGVIYKPVSDIARAWA